MFTGIYAQSQNILLLESTVKYKNFKFYEGHDIHLKVRIDSTSLHVKGVINAIYDSSIIVNYNNIILLKDIEVVYRGRMWTRILSYSAIVVGTGYLVLDSFNRAINKEYPIFDEDTMVTSGIIIGFGLLLIPFREHHYKIGKRWEVKTLVLY